MRVIDACMLKLERMTERSEVMAKRTFGRSTGLVFAATSPSDLALYQWVCRMLDAHSSAIEQLEEDSRRLTKTEGRHRRRMEKIEARLEAPESREYWNAHVDYLKALGRALGSTLPPAPEPVVVEGPFMLIGRAREMLELAGRVGVCACGGAPFHDDDRVRLTIERIDEHDDA